MSSPSLFRMIYRSRLYVACLDSWDFSWHSSFLFKSMTPSRRHPCQWEVLTLNIRTCLSIIVIQSSFVPGKTYFNILLLLIYYYWTIIIMYKIIGRRFIYIYNSVVGCKIMEIVFKTYVIIILFLKIDKYET